MHQTASKEQLNQRRRQLRQQQRVKAIKSLWQIVCMSGILAGVGWVVMQPNWTLSKPEQVQIEGNQYLSEKTIRSMLAITYPQPILELAPEQLKARLLEQGSIASVRIDRLPWEPTPHGDRSLLALVDIILLHKVDRNKYDRIFVRLNRLIVLTHRRARVETFGILP